MRKQNVMRILALVITMVMMFSVASCNFGKKPAETTPQETTTTKAPEATSPQATEPQATEPAATEPVVTEPAVTEPAVTEPVEPGPGEPCETHDYGNRFEKKWGICVVCGYVDDNHEHSVKDGKCEYCDYEFEAIAVPSTFDNDNDGNMDVFYFSAALPEEFKGEDVIWLDAYNGSTGDHMTYDEIKTGSGTLPYPHVYCYDKKATDSIVFTLTVEKAGLYNVAAHYRIKDQKVRGAKFIANEGTEFEYAINHTYGWATADDAYECRNNDFLIGSYMTGIVLPLQAGENTITIRVADGVAKSQHFRDLYLVWAEDLPAADEPAEPVEPEVLTMDQAEAIGVVLAQGAKLPETYLVTVTFNNGAPRNTEEKQDGFCRVKTTNGHLMSVYNIVLTGDQTMPVEGDTVTLRCVIGCVKSNVNGDVGQEARLFDCEIVG